MSKQWKAKRAGSDAPRGNGGRWRCFRCDGPNAKWHTSPDPAQALRYHRARYHRCPEGADAFRRQGNRG